jgi:glycosyltransferase involved in cell wall biosynthesis
MVGPVPPPYYGAAVANQTLLNSSVRGEFDLSVLNTIDRRSVTNMGRLDLVNVWLALSQAARLVVQLATTRVDAVYLHVNDNAWAYVRDAVFMFVAWAYRQPIIGHFHTGNFAGFAESASPLVRRLIHSTLPMLSAAIVLGHRVETQLRPLLPAIPIFVVPNGIDPRSFQDLQRAWCSGSPFTVLFVGHLFEAKGYLDVLRAAPLVLAKNPGVRFVFAGGWASDEERRRALEFVATNQLEDKVLFLGIITGPTKLQAFAQADVLVLPSYHSAEGQPLVILEAMAAGLPVIASDQGVITETVVHGETGIIIPRRAAGTLASTILLLVENPMLAHYWGLRGRKRLLQYYTTEVFARNMARVFNLTTT